jgi:hypothetical protein
MIAAKKKQEKKEKLKDIIEAVAAKESLLRPLPAADIQVMEDTFVREKADISTAAPAAARGISFFSSFWRGFVQGLGFMCGVLIMFTAVLYLAGKVLDLPYLAGYLDSVVSFVAAIISTGHP